MNKKLNKVCVLLLSVGAISCNPKQLDNQGEGDLSSSSLKPVVVTDSVIHDSDDPAIWINPDDPSKSLLIGTDKNADGALFVFDLEGNSIDSLTVKDLQRPNNVDIGYGFLLGNDTLDFAVTGERLTSKLRFYSLPDMKELIPGGIEIYLGETGSEYKDLMGVAVYQSPKTSKTYIIAGRKNGPKDGTYLWQYEMLSIAGNIQLNLVRKFGAYSGKNEIEAIAVDSELGYIYYSDEGAGVRKYHAEPELGNEELAFFGDTGFAEDHEGISIYKSSDSTGYILVSDQGANYFHVFPREGSGQHLHQHESIAKIPLSTNSSDGSEVTHVSLGEKFPRGMFIAMSDDKTYQIYRWEDLEEAILNSKVIK